MAQRTKLLTVLEVARLTKPGRYFDGDGLYLQVQSESARSWIYRYTLDGKARWHGLGSARDVSLAQARADRDKVRQSLREKVDPVAAKEAVKLARKAAAVQVKTFAECVDEYLDGHATSWRNAVHRQQWRSTLTTYALPVIGKLPHTAVTAGHVVDILRPIWIEKHETARRLRGRIEAVLAYAADPDDMAFRNPAALTEQLRKKLPRLPAAKQPKHHAALPYVEIGAFMVELRQRDSIAARALEFVILTATRTSETLLATWSEFDLPAMTWTIPADRMKAGRLHRVPLSDAAVAVVEHMASIRQNEYVFPGMKAGKPLSNMSMLAVLTRLGRSDLTTHGFRSTFRDWCGEHASLPREVAEACLAHVIPDKSEAAYARGDLLERRRPVMTQWAQYCRNHPGSGAQVPLKPS